jgi:hypothetical protein
MRSARPLRHGVWYLPINASAGIAGPGRGHGCTRWKDRRRDARLAKMTKQTVLVDSVSAAARHHVAEQGRLKSTGGDDYLSASQLARLGYCERQVVFDAEFGRRTTRPQREAQERGLQAHAVFFEESQRLAVANARKGRCMVATLVLGECIETRTLRAFRDQVLRRSVAGRWMVRLYYRLSPGWCGWLARRPRAQRLVRPFLLAVASLADLALAARSSDDGSDRS